MFQSGEGELTEDEEDEDEEDMEDEEEVVVVNGKSAAEDQVLQQAF